MGSVLQREAARVLANECRAARAVVYADLRSGRTTLDVLLSDPPQCIRRDLLLDVVRQSRGPGSRRGTMIQQLGRDAVTAGVNLLVPVGRASVRSRRWVATHGRLGPASGETQAQYEIRRAVERTGRRLEKADWSHGWQVTAEPHAVAFGWSRTEVIAVIGRWGQAR